MTQQTNAFHAKTTTSVGPNKTPMLLQFPSELGTQSISSDGKSLEHFMVFYVNTMQNDRYFGDKGTLLGKRNSNDSPAYESVARPDAAVDVISSSKIANTAVRLKSWARTTMMIALPMPIQLSKSYNANWSSMQTSGGLGSDFLVGGISGIADKLVQEAINKRSAAAAKSGRVLNPRHEVLFESMMPGINGYEWTLYPRTPEESKAIWNIIQIFKWGMMPDVEKDGIYFDVPNTFDIEFWTKDKRNDWLPRPMTSFIRSLNVNYSPAGHWVALNLDKAVGEDWPEGAPPVGVNIAIDLGELIPLDKRIIDPSADLTFGRNLKQGTF